MSVRERPIRSARMPAPIPPTDDATSVTELTTPALAADQWNSERRVWMAKTYSSTSMASSM